MKIGIIGNINNIYFSLTRYLADKGYDCDLLLFDYEPPHFHPSADTFRNEFNFTIRQLSWGDPARILSNKKQVKADLEPYDFLIGSGSAPAFATSIGRTLDIFIPNGDDLYALPFPRIVHPKRQLAYLIFSWLQRRGILQCQQILFDKATPAFEKVFQRLGYRHHRIVSPLPLFYHKEYDEKLQQEESSFPFADNLKTLRAENELLVVQHARQHWKSTIDTWSRKGNDYLMKGFASFLQKHPNVKAKLILFEYGIDVGPSKDLINALGIQHAVQWFPKMERRHLLYVIKAADLVVGELFHAWNSYCVVLEALYMNKPIMHKRNDADLEHHYDTLYPMIHAECPQSVLAGLEQACENKRALQEMGSKGKKWFLQYCVEKPMREIYQLIERKRAT